MQLPGIIIAIVFMSDVVFCSEEAHSSTSSDSSPDYLDGGDNRKEQSNESVPKNKVDNDIPLLYYKDLASAVQNVDPRLIMPPVLKSVQDQRPINYNKRQFSPWGGKRSEERMDHFQIKPKGDDFHIWERKRNFNSWGGKRDFNAWGGKRDFNAWGGKRSQSNHKKQKVDLLERYAESLVHSGENLDFGLLDPDCSTSKETRNFNSWGGKRNFNAWGGKRNFNSWGGKRNFNSWGGKRNFNSWGGKRNFNSWGGKRNFNSWGGRRSFNAWGDKRNFNSWGGKKNFNSWGGK